MVWWDPFEDFEREIERMRRRLFRDLYEPQEAVRRLPFKGMERVREPICDVWEDEKDVFLTLEIPGVKKENIKIRLTEDEFEVTADTKTGIKEEGEGIKRAESRYFSFYKKMKLPTKVIPEKAKATFENGVLEIKIPKKEERKGFEVKIN
jgi:HSP20 family protein